MKAVRVSFFILFFVQGIRGHCPEGCHCQTGTGLELLVDCNQQDLASIPDSTPNWTRTLILSGNRIKFLDLDTVAPRVHTLVISSNKIDQVHAEENSELQHLDISDNRLESLTFLSRLPDLRTLNVARNRLKHLNSEDFANLVHLEEINLNSNPIAFLPNNLFANNRNLEILSLSHLIISYFPQGLLDNLGQLKSFTASNNPLLNKIPATFFKATTKLNHVDLGHNQLSVLPRSLSKLPELKNLDVSDNPLHCDCHLTWFLDWMEFRTDVKQISPEETRCIFRHQFSDTNCSSFHFDTTYFIEARLGEPVVLDCDLDDEPFTEITWRSPWDEVINSSAADPDVRILPSGQLTISSANRHTVGVYTCHAYNSVTNRTANIKVQISAAPLRKVEIESLYAGAACCGIFIIITGIVQGVRYLLDYMGWWECCYCCGKRLSPRAKQIRHFLEDIEQYKTAQLDRLRDNYQMQVNKIRENCTQQIERLRDSYQGQVKYLRGVRDSGTQHLTTLREQYAEQARRVYDYSCDSVARVRRNYVSQRARVRKFSAHQLIRLRETYKFQQKTLNKILENIPALYLDNCRSAACARTDSVYFDDEPDVDIVNSILKQSINIALPDDIDEEVSSGTPPEGKTPLDQAIVAEENRHRKRGHSRQASASSLDFSAFFPPIRFPSRISWRRRNPETTGATAVEVSVAVEICAPSTAEGQEPQDSSSQDAAEQTGKSCV